MSGLWRELRTIAARGREAWHLVPARRRLALGGAAAIMAVTGLSNTAIPLLLGRLIDEASRGLARGLSPTALYRLAASYLIGLGAAYLVREALNVVRRYLVE